nr:hypothetical protein CFP56_19034 [Quercus suber]
MPHVQSGYLLRAENEPSKDDVVVTSSVAKFQDRRTTSPTSSLELIISLRGGSKAKATSKVLIASFWEDVGIATQKAHDTISVEDLEPLMGKPPSELMSSHVHKIMQVLGESLYVSEKYLDYDKKLVEAQSGIASLFTEN